jgi:polysaccharide biosynthesis transport protein
VQAGFVRAVAEQLFTDRRCCTKRLALFKIPKGQNAVELRQYLAIIQRRKWVILLTAVMIIFATGLFNFLATPQYVSATTLRVATVTDISYTQLLMNTYARIVTSGTVRGQLRERLGLEGSPRIAVELIPGTELMLITAEAPDPAEAQAIAAAAADVLVAQSREIYSGGGQSTTEILAKQLADVESDLNRARAEYDQLLADSPQNTSAIDAINQSIALKERTQATLLDQYERARLNETLIANSVSVVEPAYLPARPAKPRTTLNLALGVLVGIMGGVGLAFLFENLDTTLYTTEQIEAATQLATVGRIPAAREDLRLARLGNGHYPQLEAFRRLRTNILTLDHAGKSQVVLLTSAQRGEGKSTVAANLAVAIAQSGRTIVIVDCDMRLPTVHKVFELPNKRGLTSVLTKEVELDGALLSSTFPRLHVLTSGPLPPNPTELLGSPQMMALIEELQQRFDFVLLDTPALLSVADAAVLAPLADNIIWVVAQAKTRRGDVATVRKQLSNVKARSVEVVVNRADAEYDYAAYRPEETSLG